MIKKTKINWISILLFALFLIFLGILIWYYFKGNVLHLSADELKNILGDGKYEGKTVTWGGVTVIVRDNSSYIVGEMRIGDGNQIIRFDSTIDRGFYDSTIAECLRKKINSNLRIIDPLASAFWQQLIITLLPLFISIFVFLFIINRVMKSSAGAANPFSMGNKNRAKIRKSETKFTDVAGIKEEKLELEEIVDYLKFPQKYAQMGARTPKGVLLVGPPGTGKTLLAKAVAGEADVPFFSISGSEFEEVFVGVGASRVREMFTTAKKSAPCIIFIDEIDAVGRKRTSSASGVTEQTLNQLLVEMDGFEPNVGIIIIAATNRRDVLDEALLRPGRFDREITLTWPDIREREAILRLHARNKNISPKVNFRRVAERTPGFNGAQLENVLNEATLLAVRENKSVVNLVEIDEAIDRVMGGPAKTSRVITENDKKTVSYHEAGHALIGLKLENASKVQKVTIIPRGQAGGYTLMTPKEETTYHSKNHLLATITGFLGGRASEEIIFGKANITTGAHDDLEKATNIARKMITTFGMSDKLGLVQFENPKDEASPFSKNVISNEVSNLIDQEIKHTLDKCYQDAYNLIIKHRKILDLIATSLSTLETITAEQIEYINKYEQLPKEVIDMQKSLETNKVSETKSDNVANEEQENNSNNDNTLTAKPNKK